MTRKTRNIIVGTVTLVLVAGALWLGDAFLGNPVSKLMATRTAEAYLAETYPDTDYEIERVGYSFKDGEYHAFVQSPSSKDTTFTFYITKGGKLRLDTFERVSSRDNTAARLDEAYRALTDRVFEGADFPYQSESAYGTLAFTRKAFVNNPEFSDVPSYAIVQDDLILDGEYDVRELGKQSGRLVVYVDGNDVGAEEAARVMCDIRRVFDEADVPFRAMDFVLRHSEANDGTRPQGEIHVADFLYEDIHPDGMTARVREADAALSAAYAREDAEKAREIKQ